jgi:hypothetical protein
MLTFVFLAIFVSTNSNSQNIDSFAIPESALKNSIFTAFERIDSFSKNGDSINASTCLKKLDPYLVLRYNVHPDKIDTFFAGDMFTVAAKGAFKELYTNVYYMKKRFSYDKFKAMFEEDQTIRTKLDSCADNINCEAIFEEKMRKTDSIHFSYLYDYVKKNGWPTLENGSLFAQGIVLHDHNRFGYYLPILKNEVLNGLFPVGIYNMIAGYKMNIGFKEMLDYPKKTVINVSFLLNNEILDSEIIKINACIKNNCPIKREIFVYESNKIEYADAFYLSLLTEECDLKKQRKSLFSRYGKTEDANLFYLDIGKTDVICVNYNNSIWKLEKKLVWPLGCHPIVYPGIYFIYRHVDRKKKKLLLLFEY